MSFAKYLNATFGNRKERGYIEKRLTDSYGMKILKFKDLGEKNQDAYVIREDVEKFIELNGRRKRAVQIARANQGGS